MITYILLDRSSSMSVRIDEVVQTLNEYVNKMYDQSDKTKITLVTFDSADKLETIRTRVKKDDWKDLKVKDVQPRGMTALNDGLIHICNLILEADKKKANLLVLTDGGENDSKVKDKSVPQSLIKKLEKKGYDVNFIGADFDNSSQAGDYRVPTGSTMIFNSKNVKQTATALAAKSQTYMSTGKTRAFTIAERKSVVS